MNVEIGRERGGKSRTHTHTHTHTHVLMCYILFFFSTLGKEEGERRKRRTEASLGALGIAYSFPLSSPQNFLCTLGVPLSSFFDTFYLFLFLFFL